MTTSLNSAVLALENIYQRISRIDVICDLLKGMESEETEEAQSWNAS